MRLIKNVCHDVGVACASLGMFTALIPLTVTSGTGFPCASSHALVASVVLFSKGSGNTRKDGGRGGEDAAARHRCWCSKAETAATQHASEAKRIVDCGIMARVWNNLRSFAWRAR